MENGNKKNIKTTHNNLHNNKRKSRQIFSSINVLCDLFEKRVSIKDLIKHCIEGVFHTELRSIFWMLCLDIISLEEIDKWESVIDSDRKVYYKKHEEFKCSEFINYINLRNLNLIESENYSNCNKVLTEILSTEHFELINLIKLDVDRTFQEIELFNNENTKQSLCRILYIWSLENRDVGYCQGMNEILGTIYYALYHFHSQHEQTSKLDKLNKESIYSKAVSLYFFINSEDYYEADIYKIFSVIMKRSLKDLYNYNDVKYREYYKNGLLDGFELIDKNLLTLEEIQNSNHSDLKKRINKIFFIYLKLIDKELFNHIYDKIEPYLFLFRWILCMLNREINSLKNIINVWDCIFAFEYLDYKSISNNDEFNQSTTYPKNDKLLSNFHFLDFLCVSMICNIREQILNEDDTCYILSMLMHFPNEENIKEIIKFAVVIRDKISDYFKTSSEFVIID